MDAQNLAQAFHEHYENLAPSMGYETKPDTAVPWWKLPEVNKNLMIAVAQAIIDAHVVPIEKLVAELQAREARLVETEGKLTEEVADLNGQLDPMRRKIERLEERNKTDRDRFSKDKSKILRRLADAERARDEAIRNSNDLTANVENDARLISIHEQHANLGRDRVPNCVCAVCRMRVAIEEKEETNLMLKKKNKELKADLAGFRGPPSKKKKRKG